MQVHLRRCSAAATPAVLVRRGEPERGTVLLKLNQIEAGCRILTQARDLDGNLGWLAALGGRLVPETEADAYIGRAVDRDPDLWVIEIEDRKGGNPFDGKLIA